MRFFAIDSDGNARSRRVVRGKLLEDPADAGLAFDVEKLECKAAVDGVVGGSGPSDREDGLP
jgi:hypothetical protein